jgi:uncharacterized protein (TIGR03000 family)
MIKFTGKKLGCIALLAAVLVIGATADANAAWGRCCGGWYSCCGDYWGGWYSGYCGGCCSSCYYPCYTTSYSSYYYPSYSGCSCSNTTYVPAVVKTSIPAPTYAYTPVPAEVAQPLPQANSTSGSFSVQVPEDAVVLVNDRPTRSIGTLRTYRANDLESGKSYDFIVRAKVTRNGQVKEETRTVHLTAGDHQTIVMSLSGSATDVQVAAGR